MVVAANKCDIGHSEATNKVFAKDDFFYKFSLILLNTNENFVIFHEGCERGDDCKSTKVLETGASGFKDWISKKSLIILYYDPSGSKVHLFKLGFLNASYEYAEPVLITQGSKVHLKVLFGWNNFTILKKKLCKKHATLKKRTGPTHVTW